MFGTGAVAQQRLEMFAGAVTFVTGEAVFRIDTIEFSHALITLGLGQDARRGDRQVLRVAAHDRLLRQPDIGQSPRVAQDEIRGWRERQHGPRHRHDRGLKRSDPIDLGGTDRLDGPGHRLLANRASPLLALRCCELLRVVDAGKSRAGAQYHRRRHEWPSQRPGPRLVDPGNQFESLGPKLVFAAPQPNTPLLGSFAGHRRGF